MIFLFLRVLSWLSRNAIIVLDGIVFTFETLEFLIERKASRFFILNVK
jgi:hypothetical protein